MSLPEGIDRSVDSEKWSGGERAKWAALKVFAITLVVVLVVWALFAVLS